MFTLTLARKPLSEPSVTDNVLKHGTGALHIETVRVGGSGREGRWPANLILSHPPQCRCVGDRQIKGDDRRSAVGGGRDGGGFADVGAKRGVPEPGGRVYGTMKILVWACTPDCAVLDLATQASGDTWGPNPRGDTWGLGVSIIETGVGTPTRFFKTVQS